uniref:Conserved oligomeric Golgi complex subunit 3 n=1 Tax=Sinocyclocheilus anshuiensis TaxID=1608454 RepID=A0A671PSB9_9TELE
MASSTEQSLPELTDKETREKVSHWDRRADPMAPLTDKQTESVLEIRAAAEVALLPAELPIEDICSLTSRSLRSAFTATLPESTEEVLLQGFQTLELENHRIQTAQQFFSWFSKLQVQMDQDEASKYRRTRDALQGYQEQCDAILSDVNAALEHLQSLQKQYLFVSTKTGTLHEACEQLLKEQSELVDLAESIQEKLSYFNALENINSKLNSPTLSVNSEGFIPMLSKLDECIEYVLSHNVSVFHTCTFLLMFLSFSHILKTTQSISPNSSNNAFTLYYVKFRAAAPKVQRLIEQVEQRSDKIPEYQQLLDEIHQCYLEQREVLLSPCINATITDLTSQNNKDHCALVRSGCAFMVHVCQDEHQLYSEFFSKPSSKLDELLEKLCVSLYDVLRPLIIHVVHLETLSELCSILKNEMLEDHVQNNEVQLTAFDAVVKQMLEDVQERLVYRTHIYIQKDILGYKPAPGDLAYPDKLQMMEKIAQSLKEEQMKLTSSSSFSDVHLEESDNKKLISSGPRSQSTVSPADLHGMWYPTVRRTLVCLSKLYRCIDRAVFQGLSQEALSACIQSLLTASDLIQKNKAVPKFFRLNSHNAILEFLLEGTPEIREHYIDSKKDVDRHLKSSCEQFIQQQTHMFVGNLEEFLTKVGALKTMAVQGGPTYNFSQQPWAQPAKINDIVMATYRILKNKLPSTLQSMSLYLANKDTEFILFKPVRVSIAPNICLC